MAWEDIKLNDHLSDWDVSEARDRAIEDRKAELLADEGPKGCHPHGAEVALMFDEQYTAADVLSWVRPYLVAGDHAAVGRTIQRVLEGIALTEAEAEARIQIDREANEPTAADEARYDDRLRGDY